LITARSYDEWHFNDVHRTTRSKMRKALRMGVEVRVTPLDDRMVDGIWEIFNESPIRQGRRFSRYGQSRESIRKEWSANLERSRFIGAFYGGELIAFLKLSFTDRYAELSGTIGKLRHKDKSPMTLLIARAVECCVQLGVPFLTYGRMEYGNKGEDSLAAFKRRLGFRKVLVPRYYVPLTVRGRLALRYGLHKPAREWLPREIVRLMMRARAAYYHWAWHTGMLARTGRAV
jgi:hypothetical protein